MARLSEATSRTPLGVTEVQSLPLPLSANTLAAPRAPPPTPTEYRTWTFQRTLLGTGLHARGLSAQMSLDLVFHPSLRLRDGRVIRTREGAIAFARAGIPAPASMNAMRYFTNLSERPGQKRQKRPAGIFGGGSPSLRCCPNEFDEPHNTQNPAPCRADLYRS